MADSTLDILVRVRERLSDPKWWARGFYARTARGIRCNANHENAVAWCLLGAMQAEGVALLDSHKPLEACVPEPYRYVYDFNDAASTTHADVLAVLDCAISAQRAKASAS